MHHFLSSHFSTASPEGLLWRNSSSVGRFPLIPFRFPLTPLPAMSDHLPQVQCTLCGLLKDPSDIVDSCRCKQCNALRIRVYRKASQTEKDHFGKLNKSRSEEFYKEHFDKFKDALSTALTAAIKDVVTVSEETGFKGAGTYMDEEDLKEKYKAKPGRAETIMKNANKYYCDNAECQMYEDLGYTSTNMTGTKRDVTSTTEMEQESKIKGKKKAKVAKGDAADNEDKANKQKAEKELTEKQVISATAIKEALEGMAEQWLKTKEAIKESKQEEFMASMKIPEKWNDISEAIEMFVTDLGVSIEAKTGDFKDISKTSTDLKKRSKEFIKNVDEMLESAKKFG